MKTASHKTDPSPKVSYSGLTAEEAEGLIYLMQNCYSIADSEIKEIVLNNNEGNLNIQGIARDQGFIAFRSRVTHEDNVVQFLSKIYTGETLADLKDGKGEYWQSIDTFYFEPDEIRVVCANPSFKEYITRYIPHFGNERKM